MRLKFRRLKEALNKSILDFSERAQSGTGPDWATLHQALSVLNARRAIPGPRNLRVIRRFLNLSIIAGLLAFASQVQADEPAVSDTTPILCHSCAEWNQPQAPFRLHGNTYYVGVHGLSVVLIATLDGLILLDGALPQSVERMVENIRALGFRVEDVRWIGVSHPHYDHVGGIAALARMSGAKVMTTQRGAEALRAGTAPDDDPQAGLGDEMRFPAVAAPISELADGQSVTLGEVTLTLHATPGHTPGGASWSWRSCEADQCVDVVYADSLNPVSAPGFRFTADGDARVAEFRQSIAKIRNLPCDVLISAHPDFSGLFEKLKAREADPSRNAFVDSTACRAYADAATGRLDKRIAEEKASAESAASTSR